MFKTNLKSFAKINIGLRILGKRADGYHDLETIFYPIKLHDEILISIEPSNAGYNSVILRSNKPYIPLNRENLCYRAVEDFFKVFNVHECYKIEMDIKKFIPVGGGLGGGSSNAASIIKLLVKYLGIDIEKNRRKILDLALSIGSDVPFFILQKPCYAVGRGEVMFMLPEFHIDHDILVVNPNMHVSTKWAFEKLNFVSSGKPPILKDLKKFDLAKKDSLVNDFEKTIFDKYPDLKTIKEELVEMGAEYASMSGSGATMFGLFKKADANMLRKCRNYYSEKKFFTYVSES